MQCIRDYTHNFLLFSILRDIFPGFTTISLRDIFPGFTTISLNSNSQRRSKGVIFISARRFPRKNKHNKWREEIAFLSQTMMFSSTITLRQQSL